MNEDQIERELVIRATPSGGPGGQHANKVSTKIVLSFDLINSKALTDTEKELLLKNLNNRIKAEGTITLQCSETRSQAANKELCLKRLLNLLRKGSRPVPKRRPTLKPKSANEKRITEKKDRAEKKEKRKPPEI